MTTDMDRYWLESTEQLATRLTADYDLATRTVKTKKQTLKAARQKLKTVLLAQQIVQDVAQLVQQQAHARIAGIVTKCLAAVFERPYTFHIVFTKKRGKTEAELEFRRGKLKLRPQDGVGGSVLDVAAFALRLACLGLQRPRRRRVVVVDEGFLGLSDRRGNKERVADLLELVAAELGFQIILVTHDRALRVGRVVEL